MVAWTKTGDGWRLDLDGADRVEPSLPRLEVRQAKDAWIVCVLDRQSCRARTGAAWSLLDAQRAALVEAQQFLDAVYRPLIDRLLARTARAASASQIWPASEVAAT